MIRETHDTVRYAACYDKRVMAFVSRLPDEDIESPNGLYSKLAMAGHRRAAFQVLMMNANEFDNYIAAINFTDAETRTYS